MLKGIRLNSLLLMTLLFPVPESELLDIVSGIASQYAEQPTIGTLDYRITIGDITPEDLEYADVFIAVSECGRIGEKGYIRVEESAWMRYIVFDCASRAPEDPTRRWMEENNILAELDYWTVERLGLVCRCGLDVEMFGVNE